MTRTISALAEIGAQYDAVLCDLWGCLHNGIAAFPEAVAALQDYRAKGGKVLLLTNSPRPKSQVILQLDQLGVPRDAWDEVATSGDAAQAAMMAGQFGTRVHHIGPERDLPFFTEMEPDIRAETRIERVTLEEAEGIVCTGLDDDAAETPEDYKGRLMLAKQAGLPLLCANPDVVVDRGEERIYCAGAIAELYTALGGKSYYFGKPHPPIYDLARRRLVALGDIPKERVLVIGDGPATDVKGGIAEEYDTLFVTGGLAAAQTGTETDPDPGKLAAYLEAEGLSPSHAIGRLR
ncbi:TIGR01459 family HAD-type hydrolase [Mangrovicoccus algicola]|uniref:TIGR01459 family HAD-type hydrolase n=1 Tax=Mangrovicoccus algicola TaxID=2771008 RepID=A0A8J6Z6U1_9RHOB|nr:TIGR01459 family HAD-type hydrolase [Mangrovicoccus algicola]MBE3637535.1 TIGR01459 family HAD-type hydrolase [Mangrovicoccus algicola]